MSSHAVIMSSGSSFDEGVMLFLQSQTPKIMDINVSSTDLAVIATNYSTAVFNPEEKISMPMSVAKELVKVSYTVQNLHKY